MIFEVIAALLGIVTVRFVFTYLEHLWSLSKYPKGPFPLPLIGNANLIKSKNICDTFTTLSKQYGNVFSFSMGKWINKSCLNRYNKRSNDLDENQISDEFVFSL